MNFTTKPDTFVLVVAALSEKMVQKENECVELRDHIASDHASMDDMQRTITDLRVQCERLQDKADDVDYFRTRYQDMSHKMEGYEHLRSQNAELWEQVRVLKMENHKLRYGGQTPEETANNYMLSQGRQVWERGDRIQCIKEVREVSGWGLKETKDWCEAYIARLDNEKEESGPGTKRSSQIPSGVGDSVKKSA